MGICKSQVLLTKKNKYLSFKTKKILIFKVKERLFFKSDGLTLASPIRDLRIILFFPGNICYVKRPQLSDTTKIITITSSSWDWGVVGSGGGVPLQTPIGNRLNACR